MKGGIVFARYEQDIVSMRRTLFHVVDSDYVVGEQLCLVAGRGVPRGYAAVVTDVRRVRLADLTPQDEVKLNCSKEEYLARWKALHPAVCEEVFAIEFKYAFADDATDTR